MIASVAKALDILLLFSPAEPRLTLTAIAQRLEMPKSTAHHLVKTLARYGFIEKLDDDSYGIGKAIIGLTQSAVVNVELRDRAAPLLRELADSCNESAYLTVRDGNRVLYIYAIESPQRLLARSAVGDHAPLYCTSVGKSILAHLPPDEAYSFFHDPDVRLEAFTSHTLTNLEQLEQDLLATRARGYSVDNQEHEEQTFCLGAPIFNSQRTVIGACSISGRDPQIVASRLPALSTNVVRTAQEISRRMGYVPDRMSSVRQNFIGRA
ncbi:MAG: IclR family transcriptional regulator [Anaerolineae bacterium]|nr:IclR family transcriptional regulator [Anaerolineae bacterium]